MVSRTTKPRPRAGTKRQSQNGKRITGDKAAVITTPQVEKPAAAAIHPVDQNGRPIRVGCIVCDDPSTAYGRVLFAKDHVVVYDLFPGCEMLPPGAEGG